MNRNVRRDVLVAGLMLFATYLGAGNLIFPPFIGVKTGENWFIAAIGFLLTGVGLPMMGLIALALRGGDLNAMSRRSWPWISKFLNIIILLMIGPLFAIPRTAATTCEMSILPFLSDGYDGKIIYIVVSALFFTFTYFLTRKGADGLDKIGGILSPILISFLLLVTVISFAKPIGKPQASMIQDNLLYFGVKNGYQTMDGLGSIVIGGAAVAFFADKGYDKSNINKMLPYCALISGCLMSIVYISFTWLGASGGAQLAQYISHRTLLLSNSMKLLVGNKGQILLACIIFFACLTTSSGLTISFTEYFYTLFNGKLSKGQLNIICVSSSFIISLIGVEGIITLAGPILDAIYPVIIVLILLNLIDKFIKHDIVVKGGLIGSAVLIPFFLMSNFEPTKAFAKSVLTAFPLRMDGFEYIFTTIIGMLVGWILSILSKKEQ